MLLKKFKPRSPSLRLKTILNKNLLKLRSFKPLKCKAISCSGRNNSGVITVNHRGGGIFSFFRCVDLFRNKSVIFKFLSFDVDKTRTSILGLASSYNSLYSYFLVPNNISLGLSFKTTFEFNRTGLNVGNTIPIGWIKPGSIIFNVELTPGHGGVISRSAGCFCRVIRQSNDFVVIRAPSGILLKLSPYSFATIGRASNINHRFEHYSSAGFNRRLGKRPSVRGEAMNPVDHPNGGKTRGGKPSMNPWGKIIK